MSEVLPDIEIFGVYDRGIPNTERIVLKVNRLTSLKNYLLILGVTHPAHPEVIWPINDQMMWLSDISMDVEGWIFIYTGKGTPSISIEVNTSQPLHNLFWNRDNVLLSDPLISPALIQIGAVEIGNKPNKYLQEKKIPPPSPPTMSELEPNWQEGAKIFFEALKKAADAKKS